MAIDGAAAARALKAFNEAVPVDAATRFDRSGLDCVATWGFSHLPKRIGRCASMPHRSSGSWRAWASPALTWALTSEAMPGTKDRRRDCPGARDRPADRTTRQTQSDRRRHRRVAGRPTWLHRPEVSRTETTAENARPSSADSRTLVVNRCRAGVRRLWRLVARPKVGRRPTPVRACSLLACDTGSGATASLSGPAHRKVTAKPVRVGPASTCTGQN
jgi:hypothetical protein